MTNIFPRARDPDVFPPAVSQFSVIVPDEPPPQPRTDGVSVPAALSGAIPKRRLEFLAGRVCARQAMERIDVSVAADALARDADGVPVWPGGVVGSIAHAGRFATAAVAEASEAFGLGVDVEPVMSETVAAEIADLVASQEERRFVAEALCLARLETLTLVFSIKESLFKALYPPTRRHFDYLDCAVVRVDPDERRFAVRFRPPFDAAYGAPEFSGRYELSDGEVRTGAFVPARR
jgi:enterobactin synthetase component D